MKFEYKDTKTNLFSEGLIIRKSKVKKSFSNRYMYN